MNEKLKEIRNIENKYGLLLFRMGLSHLVDVGHSNFDNSDEIIMQIMDAGEADKATGVTPIMTLEFQCEIVRCASELAKFSIWTLLNYIKKYVNTSK